MVGVRLVTTRRFAVYGSTKDKGLGTALEPSSSSTNINNKAATSAMTFEKDGAEVEVPTMRLRELNKSNASRFVGLMEKHGFIVLTEVGAIRKAYLEFMQLLKAFFEGGSDWKETKKGRVHFNERGIPMWHTGYERCGRVREAFRIPTELARPSFSSSFSSSSSSSACCSSSTSSPPSSSLDPWPCQHLRRAWLELLRHLQLVCHRALTLTLARPVHGAPPSVKATRRPATSSRSATAPMVPPGQTREGRKLGGGAAGGGGRRGGREGGRGGGGGGNREGECCLPVALGRFEGDLKEAVEVAAAASATVATEVTGATEANGQAEGRAGNEHELQGSGERRSRERCPVCLSQVAGGSDTGGGGGDDAGSDAGGGDAGGDDFSVSYALHYPNEFADPALEKEDLTVGEHVDPSLFVAEPCCGVEGLEILDRASQSWLPVEALCAGLGANGKHSLAEAEGRELVLFGGKALERATEARVRGAPHRVRRGNLGRRYCFIYEQKYAEFFPPPALD